MTPAGGGPPMAAPPRSGGSATAASPRRRAGRRVAPTPAGSRRRGTTAPTAAGWPVALKIAKNGTREATSASVLTPPRCWYWPIRDGPVAVPGVISTSKSSKIDCTRAASVGLGCADLGDLAVARSARRSARWTGCAAPAVPGAAASARRRTPRATSGAARGRTSPTPDSRGRARAPRGRGRAAASPRRRGPAAAHGRPGATMVGGSLVLNAIRNRPGLRAAALTNPPRGALPVWVASRNSAASSTVRLSGPLTTQTAPGILVRRRSGPGRAAV